MRPPSDQLFVPRAIGHSSLVAAALASLFVTYSLQASSAVASIVLGVWLLLPYAALAALLETRSSAAAALTVAVTAFLVAAGGVALLILVVFVAPDAQGAIAVVLTPAYQAVAAAVLLPIMHSLCVRSARRRALR